MKLSLSLSILDQALLSAFNLALAILIIRQGGPEVFGVYSIVLAVALVLTSAQNALVGAQLSVLRPLAKNDTDERALLTTCWTVNASLIAVSMLLTGIGTEIIDYEDGPMLALGAALYVGATLLREYVRHYLFSELRTLAVLVTDAGQVLISATGLALYWPANGSPDVATILIVLALAGLLSSAPAIADRLSHFKVRFDDVTRDRFVAIWHLHSRWTMLGALTSEVQQRAHVFVVGFIFGPAAVGVLQASGMIFRPLTLIMMGWERITRPTLSRLFAENESEQARRWVHWSVVGVSVVSLAGMLAIWAGWPLLEKHVFRGAYPDVEVVVVLWGIATFLRHICVVYGIELQALVQFRELSLANVTGALVAMSTLAFAIASGPYQWSILAIIMGHLTDLAIVLLILRATFASSHPSRKALLKTGGA